MRGQVLAGLCVAVISTSAFAQEAQFSRPYWIDRAVIESLGNAQITARPDQASFAVTFREVAASSRGAMFAASDRARLAAAAVRSRGGDAVEIGSRADIEAIHQEYRNRDGEHIASERADQIENYAVSVRLQIKVTDIARAANVRAAAMAVGPEEISDLTYSLSETATARLEAYRAAVQDAATRARIAAQASGAVLGRLLVMQDGRGPCLGQWQNGASSRRETVQETPTSNAAFEGEIVVTANGRRDLTLSSEDIERMQLPTDVPQINVVAQVCAVYAAG